MEAARPDDHIRLAELIASLSLATDLGLGQPLEHELGVCLSALELADRLGCAAEESSDVYYVALLAHVGCTAAAPYFAGWVGGDEIHFQSGVQVLEAASEPAEDIRYLMRRLADDRPLPERARLVARQLVGGQKQFELAAANLCEGGRLLARRLRMPDGVARALGQVTARCHGKGVPAGLAGDEIPRPPRIVRVAHDLVAIGHARDLEAATKALRRRRGRGYDPDVVDAALADAGTLLGAADVPDAWERVIAAEPDPPATISRAGLESVARAFAEFTDLKVGFLRGHSNRVAELAATGGRFRQSAGAQSTCRCRRPPSYASPRYARRPRRHGTTDRGAGSAHHTKKVKHVSHTMVNPDGLHDPVPFGYSHTAAVPAGTELVLVSGQYGSGADGAVVSHDFTEQVQQAFRNLGVALGAHGLDLSQVVQLRTYVVNPDFDKLGAIGQAVRSGCGDTPPTQTVIGVAGLAMPDILFEVEAVAARP